MSLPAISDSGNGNDLLKMRWPILFFDSANIAAGGNTPTTAQLTAPANKNSSNFNAGFISDDTNPLPSIDIGTNNYSEVEFAIQADANYAANNDVFKFRITANGNAFNSYTLTPQWTIGTAGNNAYNCTITDTGLGNDATAGIIANLALSDSGTGADLNPIQVALPTLADSASGTDLLSFLLASVGITDTATGADLIQSLTVALNLPETATGTDVLAAVMVQFGIDDAGTAVDLIQAFFLVSLADSGAGEDQLQSLAVQAGI